jgi:hypothetical protein
MRICVNFLTEELKWELFSKKFRAIYGKKSSKEFMEPVQLIIYASILIVVVYFPGLQMQIFGDHTTFLKVGLVICQFNPWKRGTQLSFKLILPGGSFDGK